MNLSQQSLQSGSDATRRGRTLYNDPEAARRNIMRIPAATDTPNANVVQDSPLANRGASPNVTQAIAGFRNREAAGRAAQNASREQSAYGEHMSH